MAPKIFFALSILCLATSIGCKKKSTSPATPDEIKTYEFNPAMEITSVDTFTSFPGASGTNSIPQPSDSSASYLLDINGDSVPDFKFTVNHWYQFVSASNPETNYNYRMSITGLQTTSEVSVILTNPISYKTKFYAFGESINSGETWRNDVSLVLNVNNMGGAYTDFSGTKYIGLRIADNYVNHLYYNYCWLKISKDPLKVRHKLLIESLGYNKTQMHDIAAGQEE